MHLLHQHTYEKSSGMCIRWLINRSEAALKKIINNGISSREVVIGFQWPQLVCGIFGIGVNRWSRIQGIHSTILNIKHKETFIKTQHDSNQNMYKEEFPAYALKLSLIAINTCIKRISSICIININPYLINIVDQFIHLLEPRLCILVLEIITHCPHDMVCPRHIRL